MQNLSDRRMTQFQNIEQLESELWAAADQLGANSKLTSSEYCMPVLGIIFLRHATNRYDDAVRQIAADQAAGKMARRTPIKLRTARGDVVGRIYEYFLMKFAMGEMAG